MHSGVITSRGCRRLWTCETGKDKNSDVVSTYTAKVPYLTKGREYRTWVWGDINGHTNTTESPGVKGNGT